MLYGKPYIQEKIGDLTFEISANSFFQTNTTQGEVLYKEVEEALELRGDEIVYDLYCGHNKGHRQFHLLLIQEPPLLLCKELHPG